MLVAAEVTFQKEATILSTQGSSFSAHRDLRHFNILSSEFSLINHDQSWKPYFFVTLQHHSRKEREVKRKEQINHTIFGE